LGLDLAVEETEDRRSVLRPVRELQLGLDLAVEETSWLRVAIVFASPRLQLGLDLAVEETESL